MIGSVLNLGVRGVLAVLALLLGLVPQVHAGPPLIAPAVEVQAPDLQPAPVVRVYLIAYRAHGPPALLLAVRATSSRSAWCIQYAYCGGDPVNRANPSGLDWVAFDGDDAYYYHEQDSWWPGRQSAGRTKIGTRGQGGLIQLEAGFQHDGRTMVEIGLLNQYAAGDFSGDMSTSFGQAARRSTGPRPSR